MLAQMGEADRDLRRLTPGRRGRVVPEPAPHAPRHADRSRTQSATEVALVVPVVPGHQLDGERLVLRARTLAPRRRLWRPDRVPNDHTLCLSPLGSRATFDEHDDR